MGTITKGGTLPDTGVTKNEVYALVDNATVTSIVDADVAAAAGIAATKLDMSGLDSAITYAVGSQPNRSIILTASGATVPGTNGAEQVQVDGTNVSYWVLGFDTTTSEKAYWTFVIPDSYNDLAITATLYWTAKTGGSVSETIDFDIAIGDVTPNVPEAIDTAPGNITSITDTALAAPVGKLHATSAISVAAPMVAGDLVIVKLSRDTGSDNLANDARVLAVKLEWGKDVDTD